MEKSMTITKERLAVAGSLLLFAATISCGGEKKLISVDGSSTVYPITQAVAEEYQKANKGINVTVGISGTGGGFKKFCAGETQISDASRPIKKSEIEKCAEKKIEYIELPVAYDGLSIVVSKENTFVNDITVDELKKIYGDDKVKTWKEVRASWPADPIKVYSPGHDSGTYDYFSEAILGKDVKVRGDAVFSEDDNVLVKGVSSDKGAVGYFGVAYYEENKATLRAVSVVNPKSKKAELPTLENVMSGAYAPLSRPIFIYVSTKAAALAEVKGFVEFYFDNAAKLVGQVGYIPLKPEEYTLVKSYFKAGRVGHPASESHGGPLSIMELYK
jgi:phosphate transport system substrate-binding protein